MSISLNSAGTVVPTKRGIVSDIAKTFDVLGWMAPSIIKMKVLYQKLWLEKLGWDDPVSSEVLDAHAKWKKQLPLLNQIKLKRCYYRVEEVPLTVQLHGFSDASEMAYSAVVYLRSTYSSSLPLVSLVSAKTKVAPLKKVTIPRLELSGARILARLLANVQRALSLPASSVHAWSDSTIVLSWLDGQPKRFKTYVGNLCGKPNLRHLRVGASRMLVPYSYSVKSSRLCLPWTYAGRASYL